MSQLGGQTNHAAALELARTELAANGRAGAQQAIILLTDGVANETTGFDPVTDAIIQSILAKSDGILIYGVAIGGQSVLDAVSDYASAPRKILRPWSTMSTRLAPSTNPSPRSC